jgi:hypothetical protein
MKVPKVLAKFIIFGTDLLPSESSIHFLLPGMVHHELKHVIDGGDGSGIRLISKAQLA